MPTGFARQQNMEAAKAAALFSLESHTPLKNFDMVGFTSMN